MAERSSDSARSPGVVSALAIDLGRAHILCGAGNDPALCATNTFFCPLVLGVSPAVDVDVVDLIIVHDHRSASGLLSEEAYANGERGLTSRLQFKLNTGRVSSATSDKGSCRSSGKSGVIDSSPSTSTRPRRAESDALPVVRFTPGRTVRSLPLANPCHWAPGAGCRRRNRLGHPSSGEASGESGQ